MLLTVLVTFVISKQDNLANAHEGGHRYFFSCVPAPRLVEVHYINKLCNTTLPENTLCKINIIIYAIMINLMFKELG